MHEVLILVTTESNKEKAKNIAQTLLQKKLAACVSIKQIYSVFEWEGEIEESEEFEITIKSKLELKEYLINFLKKNLSYDVPQILFNKFHAESKYYEWISKTN